MVQQKIKLQIFTPNMQCGGSEKFLWLLCNHISTEKFLVQLVVLDNANAFYTIKNPAIEIIDLKEKRVRYSLFRIKRQIKKFQPDIVFSTSNHLNVYLAIFRNSFSKQIKFVARESSVVSINTQRSKLSFLYNGLIKKYYHRLDMIICQSVYMQQDLINNYSIPENKTRIIHNAAEEIVATKPPLENVGAGKVFKLITVARFSPEKGIERLINAVGLLSVPLHYFVIGSGQREKYLRELVQKLEMTDKIFFVPEKTDPFAGMEDADLYLMGSYYEGFPNVLLEAGMLGIPVVAFNVPGGIAEIITEDMNGSLVGDNDLLDFAAAVNRGLTGKYNRAQIIEMTRQRFSVKNSIPAMENLFLSLAADK